MTYSLSASVASGSKTIPLEDVLPSFLTNEKFHDVKLKGTDGVPVGANRCVLASRSAVFDRMFFGEFKESTSGTVETSFTYTGEIIQAVVEYIHTNTCKLLTDEDSNANVDDTDRIGTMLDLMEAAEYFDLTDLGEKTLACIAQSVKSSPSLSFFILGKILEGVPIPQELITFALFTMQSSYDVALPPGALKSFTRSSVEKLLKDEDLMITEFHRFEFLRLLLAEDGQSQAGDASALKERIRLELILPAQLTTTVETSEVFSKEQLYEGLKIHALAPLAQQLEGKHYIPKQYRRPLPVWKRSHTSESTGELSFAHCVDVLDVPPFVSGVHQWAIEVKSLCNLPWVGIACCPGYTPDQWLGLDSVGWVYGSNGAACHNEENDRPEFVLTGKHPKYEAGSLITLTLDLRPGVERNGSLRASVDGGASFLLFSDLRSALEDDEGNNAGFNPAVSLRTPGCMKLVDLRKLED